MLSHKEVNGKGNMPDLGIILEYLGSKLECLVSAFKHLSGTILNIFLNKTADKVAENISNSKDTGTHKHFKRYQVVNEIKDNQKTFNTFIALSKSNLDQTKIKYQKKALSIQHPLHNAVISEKELWEKIKASTSSQKEREILNELLLIVNNKTTVEFSSRRFKTIGNKRLSCCKKYVKKLKKYQKIPIENYQAEKLDCLNDYVKATKSYYELLYVYLPNEERNILEKSFNK